MTRSPGETVRRPAVAGLFYPEERRTLEEEVRRALKQASADVSSPHHGGGLSGVVGLLVPHAGYAYSGPVAAHAYARLASFGRPRSVVLIGPDHFSGGEGLSIAPWDEWETPLGPVPLDRPLAERLMELHPALRWGEAAHLREHSLEVQLPFLQVLFSRAPSIVPIAMSDQRVETAVALGRVLAAAMDDGVALVATSDLSHYVPEGEARRRDRRLLEAVQSLDAEAVERRASELGVNMCGPGPVMALLAAMRDWGVRQARLLRYATSADAGGDPAQVVGYAAVWGRP